jgi:3-phenylpropionate/trans-cinnamate dioxygenase ferredoxin component
VGDSDGWQRVAALPDLADDAALPARLGNRRIALYRLDGKVHALDDVCTHALALLSRGFIENGAVECPLHGARFDIATGRCLAPPATVDLRVHEVRIEGGEIFVRVP